MKICNTALKACGSALLALGCCVALVALAPQIAHAAVQAGGISGTVSGPAGVAVTGTNGGAAGICEPSRQQHICVDHSSSLPEVSGTAKETISSAMAVTAIVYHRPASGSPVLATIYWLMKGRKPPK